MDALRDACPAATVGVGNGTITPPPSHGPTRKALKVGKYILLKTLGKGSSSEVKLAQHSETGEHVAVKVMSKTWIQDNGMTAAVNREITLMSNLKHRNVVELKEVMNSPTSVYMVMELVKGHELYDEIVEQVMLPEPRARKYFRQIVDGIAYLHSQGVVHRDLKPENILVSSDGVIKITDFGLSAMCGRGNSHRRQRSVCGTPYYTAPEVFGGGGARSYDARRADVWSAGIVLFTMLAGQLPFEGNSAEQALDLISTQEVVCPAHFSAEARDLVARMLTKEATTRISLEGVALHPWLMGHKVRVACIVEDTGVLCVEDMGVLCVEDTGLVCVEHTGVCSAHYGSG
ncbi:kinase-like domain-containing protein [Tribonema minus]|uniref:non-specific serine/threonine protein kinase n=1 Tax=Tribonema minus TaxID=303371 RepID=A0A836CAF3_9STRA|nr:kinase-like domain-containing protein [Tribonema minus]